MARVCPGYSVFVPELQRKWIPLRKYSEISASSIDYPFDGKDSRLSGSSERRNCGKEERVNATTRTLFRSSSLSLPEGGILVVKISLQYHASNFIYRRSEEFWAREFWEYLEEYWKIMRKQSIFLLCERILYYGIRKY